MASLHRWERDRDSARKLPAPGGAAITRHPYYRSLLPATQPDDWRYRVAGLNPSHLAIAPLRRDETKTIQFRTFENQPCMNFDTRSFTNILLYKLPGKLVYHGGRGGTLRIATTRETGIISGESRALSARGAKCL